jgi:hypothetical protein
MATILKRRAKSGFVNYPKNAERRTIDGTARFRTRCDMLVGPCACGSVHQENEPWVRTLLEDYEYSIDTLAIYPNSEGKVCMPRYWANTPSRPECDTLHGPCNCGEVHRANERWVQDMLNTHNAVILNCPAALDPVIGVEDSETRGTNSEDMAGTMPGCDCEACRRARRQVEGRGSRLNRRDI